MACFCKISIIALLTCFSISNAVAGIFPDPGPSVKEKESFFITGASLGDLQKGEPVLHGKKGEVTKYHLDSCSRLPDDMVLVNRGPAATVSFTDDLLEIQTQGNTIGFTAPPGSKATTRSDCNGSLTSVITKEYDDGSKLEFRVTYKLSQGANVEEPSLSWLRNYKAMRIGVIEKLGDIDWMGSVAFSPDYRTLVRFVITPDFRIEVAVRVDSGGKAMDGAFDAVHSLTLKPNDQDDDGGGTQWNDDDIYY